MTIDLFIVYFLVVVIGLLILDRYINTFQHQKEKDKLLDELSKAIKAVISKNANDYVMTASIDKVPTEDKPLREPDEIPEEALNDEDFFKAIKKGNEK